MLYRCPNCEKFRLDDGRKCPHCGADSRGGFHGGKHAIEPRELNARLKRIRCEHGILRDRPCSKCLRDEESAKSHETPILMFLKQVVITFEIASDADALDAARVLRAAIDAKQIGEGDGKLSV